MKMGFFKLYKPKEYKYRFIYYDPKKEAQKEREKKLAEEQNNSGEFRPSIKRGMFREMADKNKMDMKSQIRNSNVRLILIIVFLLILMYFILM